jgi:hypothetical protein
MEQPSDLAFPIRHSLPRRHSLGEARMQHEEDHPENFSFAAVTMTVLCVRTVSAPAVADRDALSWGAPARTSGTYTALYGKELEPMVRKISKTTLFATIAATVLLAGTVSARQL